jgi:membrane associated rhomboid family serine protease
MLSDRPYMRDAYQRERTSFVIWLVSALLAGFVIQLAISALVRTGGFEYTARLSAAAIRRGDLWTLVTYPFVHRGALHALVLVLAVFFLGRELSPLIGDRRLAWLALGSTVAGGLAWFGFHYDTAGALVGASSLVWCYFAVFACLFPNRELSFLVFFVLPLTLRPKYIAWGLVAVDLVGLVLTEIMPDPAVNYHIPHSAHLGALLVGWIYFRYFHETNWLTLRPRTAAGVSRWRQQEAKTATLPSAESPAKNAGDIRAEVDRILDKINSHGLGALSVDEKRVLDNAKAHLSR